MSDKKEIAYTIDSNKVYEKHQLALERMGIDRAAQMVQNVGSSQGEDVFQDIMPIESVYEKSSTNRSGTNFTRSDIVSASSRQPRSSQQPGSSRQPGASKPAGTVVNTSDAPSSQATFKRPQDNIHLQRADDDMMKAKFILTGGIEVDDTDGPARKFENKELNIDQDRTDNRQFGNIYKMMNEKVDKERG